MYKCSTRKTSKRQRKKQPKAIPSFESRERLKSRAPFAPPAPDPRNQDAVHTPSNMKLTPFMWAYLWNSKSPYLASNLGSWLVESRWCDQCRVFGGRPNMEGIYGGENMAFISRVLCPFDGESLAYLLDLWFTGVSIVSFRVLPPPDERVYCFNSRGFVRWSLFGHLHENAEIPQRLGSCDSVDFPSVQERFLEQLRFLCSLKKGWVVKTQNGITLT